LWHSCWDTIGYSFFLFFFFCEVFFKLFALQFYCLRLLILLYYYWIKTWLMFFFLFICLLSLHICVCIIEAFLIMFISLLW
jgi:hypothetical protein